MPVSDLWRLDGKVAVVVGGTGGMGVAFSTALAESGARLVVVGTTKVKADGVAEVLRSAGHEAVGLKCDVRNDAEVLQMALDAVARFGRIDILINTAGINVRKVAEQVTEEEWLRVIDVNLVGAWRVARAVGRQMIAQRSGKVVTISSTRGTLALPWGYTAYCASKGGVNMLTKQLATEWAKYGICVNAIAPTYIDTPLIGPLLADKEIHERLIRRIPMGRLGQTSDLVGAAIYLCSPASDFVTGHVLTVDGCVSATEF